MAELIKCPDCDRTFTTHNALGPHRQKAHGYSLKDGKNDPKRIAKGNPRPKKKKVLVKPSVSIAFDRNRGKFPCSQCDFVASWTGGLKKHMRKHLPKPMEGKHELAKHTQNAKTEISATNGHIQTQDDGNHRLEAAATFAAGRISELLQSIALKHDLPARSLAALVLRVVHAETVR